MKNIKIKLILLSILLAGKGSLFAFQLKLPALTKCFCFHLNKYYITAGNSYIYIFEPAKKSLNRIKLRKMSIAGPLVAYKNKIYIIDKANKTINIYDIANFRLLGRISSSFHKKNFLISPAGIEVFQNKLIVSDSGRKSLCIYTTGGKFLKEVYLQLPGLKNKSTTKLIPSVLSSFENYLICKILNYPYILFLDSKKFQTQKVLISAFKKIKAMEILNNEIYFIDNTGLIVKKNIKNAKLKILPFKAWWLTKFQNNLVILKDNRTIVTCKDIKKGERALKYKIISKRKILSSKKKSGLNSTYKKNRNKLVGIAFIVCIAAIGMLYFVNLKNEDIK